MADTLNVNKVLDKYPELNHSDLSLLTFNLQVMNLMIAKI